MPSSFKPALILATALNLFLNSSASAQESADNVRIEFKTPKEWRGETLKLPPGFARDLKLTGLEEIRFAPGMFQPDSESFFSYFFVFWLPNQKPLEARVIHDEMLTYYRGLFKAVSRGRAEGVNPESFTLKMSAVKNAVPTWQAELSWVEPFRTLKPQKLRFEIQSVALENGKDSLLKVTASPTDYDSPIWKKMRGMLKTVSIQTVKEPE